MLTNYYLISVKEYNGGSFWRELVYEPAKQPKVKGQIWKQILRSFCDHVGKDITLCQLQGAWKRMGLPQKEKNLLSSKEKRILR